MKRWRIALLGLALAPLAAAQQGRGGLGGRGPQRACGARPACARADLGAPRPQVGAAPRRARAEFVSRGRAALRNFAAFRADFASRQSGATPASGWRGGRGLETIPGAGPQLVLALYQQAAEAVNAVPAMAAPQMLADIASDEMRLFPQQGLADFTTAFELARALPPPQGDNDAVGQAREAFKENAEREAVGELARRGDEAQALALTRLADIPKAPLYDQLIALAGRRRRKAAADPEGETTLERVFDLVQECKRSGSYPYTGVAVFLRRRAGAGLERLTLVQDGYQWAGNETAPAQIEAAAVLLQAGHQAEPALDGLLATTLRTLLQRLEQAGASPAYFGPGRFAQIRLMALLRQVNAPAAAALAAQAPGLQGPTPGMMLDPRPGGFAAGLRFAGRGGRGLMLFPSRAPAAGAGLDPASTAAGGASAFRALLAQAESLQRQDRSQALALAGRAAGMLDDSLWASQASAAARLATLEQQLGDGADAARLLRRCLEEADRQARALDATYLGAGASQRAQLAQGLEAAQGTVLMVYSLAARLDFVGTAERAEAAQFVLLKPLVLARVALVGEVGERPVPPL